jgi:hypothetical protein
MTADPSIFIKGPRHEHGLHTGKHLEELAWLAGLAGQIWGGRRLVAMLSAHAEHTHQDTSLFSPLSDTRAASLQLKH